MCGEEIFCREFFLGGAKQMFYSWSNIFWQVKKIWRKVFSNISRSLLSLDYDRREIRSEDGLNYQGYLF